jgi:hypothetical protein
MINVQVRTASGKILDSHGSPGLDKFFQADAASYPLLAHIVPWTNTAFNRSQVAALRIEIERYQKDPTVNPDGERFEWLQDLIRVASAEPHRMLWFVGD